MAYGYSFNENIAIELGYGVSGDFKFSILDVDSFSTYFDNFSGSQTNFDIAAVGRLPIGEVFALTAKLGVSRVKSEISESGVFFVDGNLVGQWNVRSSQTSTPLNAGVGFEISWFNAGYELTKDVEVFDGIEEDFDRFYAGVKFNF